MVIEQLKCLVKEEEEQEMEFCFAFSVGIVQRACLCIMNARTINLEKTPSVFYRKHTVEFKIIFLSSLYEYLKRPEFSVGGFLSYHMRQ